MGPAFFKTMAHKKFKEATAFESSVNTSRFARSAEKENESKRIASLVPQSFPIDPEPFLLTIA